MRYRVKHITEYKYVEAVTHCYNLAHMTPRSTRRQRCFSSDVIVSPRPAVHSQRVDYFGNQAYQFEIQQRHKKLTITVVSDIETKDQPISQNFDFGISCAEALAQIQHSTKPDDILAREFLLSSPLIRIQHDEIREYAAASFEDDKPLLSCVMDLTSRIYRDFEYSPESTTVSTPLIEVLEKKQGVCQDFAHFQIACLRALGFPSKYVSGYIETLPPPGKEKLVGADASHAWISVYSPAEGWVEFDPTNDTLATEQHIITAWGRDYSDVTPLKGIVYGGGEDPVLHVSVDVAAQ
ncbi:transglutaminase family protein [Aurantivibrio plasticivorans]